MEPYIGKGKNITTDNFFTRKTLATENQKKRATLVGTSRNSRLELSAIVKGKKDNCILTIYVYTRMKNLAKSSAFKFNALSFINRNQREMPSENDFIL